mgnify:CR=1 FL=1
MSYVVKYLSDIKTLKKELEENPDKIKYYLKYEGFTGSSESMTYIEQKINEYISLKNNQKNS